MKRWCVHHDAEIMQQVSDMRIWVCWNYEPQHLERCQEVEALLIVKENGEWPKWAKDVIPRVGTIRDMAAVLDALSSVGYETERDGVDLI